ncbi:hypothetical protein OAV69_03250 [Gammaproteobacteria bacterium]|nr:hypothetical protein [Gammaproteobacteria bacterium]
MKKLLALLLLFGIVGCMSNSNGSNLYQYQPPSIDISGKDCDGETCVEISNYDIRCDEGFSGFDKCEVTISYKTESSLDDWMDIVCRATINVFDYMNQMQPEILSDTQKNRHWQRMHFLANSYHTFSFDSYSETNRVNLKAIECGVNDLPPAPYSGLWFMDPNLTQQELIDLYKEKYYPEEIE